MMTYLTRPCRNGVHGWIAMAKQGPFITDGDAVREPGDLWFEFGATRDEALGKLQTEIRSLQN